MFFSTVTMNDPHLQAQENRQVNRQVNVETTDWSILSKHRATMELWLQIVMCAIE